MLAAGLFATTPASAGNWEETLLDPPPARIEAGVTYTFGYWILQHGSYPYQGGDLGPTALRAVDEKGTVLDFPGVGTATAGHYSAEVVFPRVGRWAISSHHEVLMPDADVAVVDVPGPVVLTPSEMTERAHYDWGPVHPSFPSSAAALVEAPVVAKDVAPRGHETAAPEPASLPVWLVVGLGAVTIGFAFLLARRYRRAN